MKYSDKYLKKAIRNTINETLEEKVDMLYGKIKEMEMDEQFDDDRIKLNRKGKGFDPEEFKGDYKLDLDNVFSRYDSTTKDEFTKRFIEDDELYNDYEDDDEDDDDLDFYFDDEDDDDLVTEGEMCEQCRVGTMNEGECNECGYKKDTMEEEEMEEGNKFSGARQDAIDAGEDEFEVDGKTYPVKESIEYRIKDNDGDIIKLNESEMIDFIENIVNEAKSKSMGKPRGLTTYEKAHKESGKENKDYMKSLEKKMKDYLKDGSKGKFEMNPKKFPKGNGELGDMDKKAFKLTDELEDFNYEIAGLNIPTPDAVEFNDEWMDNLYKGDSKTGNAPGGNALDSDANERFNKLRKKNTLKKIKDQSYKRVPQPVFNEKSGDSKGKGLNIKLETIEEKKEQVLNEEFDRMKELFSYDRKTQ